MAALGSVCHSAQQPPQTERYFPGESMLQCSSGRGHVVFFELIILSRGSIGMLGLVRPKSCWGSRCIVSSSKMHGARLGKELFPERTLKCCSWETQAESVTKRLFIHILPGDLPLLLSCSFTSVMFLLPLWFLPVCVHRKTKALGSEEVVSNLKMASFQPSDHRHFTQPFRDSVALSVNGKLL